MCLGEVAVVRQIAADGSLIVESPVRRSTVSALALHEPVGPGDWVLTHSGFALARLTESAARAALAARSGESR
ncbi:MAG TPA: HypC/HybG/HupF family hydrogenase formation chaperone [Mycobacteriales bacterium]|nr:HypC/HybG/HupF family hydrogenase formation chaperone [Mycobacteriales bacterium]